MEMKYVVPDMAQSFGTLEFASYILAVLFVLLTMLIGILLKKASKTF